LGLEKPTHDARGAARHVLLADLESGLDDIRRAPSDTGRITLIVRRPAVNEREVMHEALLDPVDGLVGDSWDARDDPDACAQITLVNSRVMALLAPDRTRWPLAGDQLFVDFDLSEANVPAGTRLAIGTAIVEVTPEPHTGCRKFAARFGVDAVAFVNSRTGRALHLRGINARVVSSGVIHVGDDVRKEPVVRP
jgi:MOSC domain-containing protein YiiM